METKKNKKVDLRNYSKIFFLIGMVVTLTVVLLSFNITSNDKNIKELGDLNTELIDDILIPITRHTEIKPPAPIELPKVSEVLNIVEDDVIIDDELEIDDTEVDENTIVNIIPFEDEVEDDDNEIFVIVEQMPKFEGGDNGLMEYISSHITYPEIAMENGISGTVFIQFLVNKKGQVMNVIVMRGVDSSLDKEAIRVVENLPNWEPGEQRGKPVCVKFTVPIKFQLN